MTNKTALVTGSSSGIGQAITEALLNDGHNVIGLARDHGKFKPRYGSYHPITVDLSDIENTETMVHGLLNEYPDISIFIGNAGY